MGAGVVGDQLRCADDGEVLVAGIGHFDRRVKTRDGRQHLVSRIRSLPRRKVATDTEREFSFGHAHVVLSEPNPFAALVRALAQQAASQRSVDRNVRLPGLAGGGDLPAKQRKRAVPLELRLNGVALLAGQRSHRLGQPWRSTSVPPMIPKDIRRCLDLLFRHHAIRSWHENGVRHE